MSLVVSKTLKSGNIRMSTKLSRKIHNNTKWWNRLNTKAQQQYLTQHPHSVKTNTAQISSNKPNPTKAPGWQSVIRSQNNKMSKGLTGFGVPAKPSPTLPKQNTPQTTPQPTNKLSPKTHSTKNSPTPAKTIQHLKQTKTSHVAAQVKGMISKHTQEQMDYLAEKAAEGEPLEKKDHSAIYKVIFGALAVGVMAAAATVSPDQLGPLVLHAWSTLKESWEDPVGDIYDYLTQHSENNGQLSGDEAINEMINRIKQKT